MIIKIIKILILWKNTMQEKFIYEILKCYSKNYFDQIKNTPKIWFIFIGEIILKQIFYGKMPISHKILKFKELLI